MRIKLSPIYTFILCLGALALSSRGVTLEQIRANAELTPATFASYFKDFDFKFRAEIQPPEAFLAKKSGDCDDYATLAASVLSEKGYTPRLVTVRMPKVVHVVCYVEETGAYLDYNVRAEKSRLVKCGSSLDAIAASVAKSYSAKWTSASEFTYGEKVKRLVATVQPGKTSPSSPRMASVFK